MLELVSRGDLKARANARSTARQPTAQWAVVPHLLVVLLPVHSAAQVGRKPRRTDRGQEEGAARVTHMSTQSATPPDKAQAPALTPPTKDKSHSATVPAAPASLPLT